ncbi:MAG: UvrD-helicase domain-containing protein [Bacilli bacterium]|nr:UvrD-helicase domain-containing protein [Bacilli bacterium]
MPKWTKEQLQAINEENTNIIVSAGAGSGKTAVLSERVIRKLKEGVNINELLILTFTNAAASEMKERIRNKIKEDPSLKDQLDLIDSSYITTFDSFSLSLLKKYHYLLNVSKDVQIIDSSLIRFQKEKIIDEIFEKKYKEEDVLFEKLIGDFCIKDDKQIKKYILNINDKLDLKINKKEYLEQYISNTFNDKKINDDINKYEQLLISKVDEINILLNKLSFLLDTDNYYNFKDSFNTLFESNCYDEIVTSLDIKIPSLPRGSSDEAKSLKEEINNLLKEIKTLCRYKDYEEIKKQILNTKDYVKVIIDIILELNQKIMNYKFKNDMYEFNDISLLVINLLKDNEEVRLEILNSFNEIMVDEYQDTNDVQEVFISLIQNNNVYMVGDIKQSIYRFRNANPYIFKNKYDKYSEKTDGIKIDLNKNFRSRSEVLSDINLIFDIIMDNVIGGADYKVSHRMIFGNDLYNEKGLTNQNNNIDIYTYDYDKKGIFSKEEIEAFIIANDIKEKIDNKYKIFDKDKSIIRDASYGDFVILMDRATNFSLYKKIFEYLEIPLNLYTDEKITEDILLSLIKNLLLLILKIKDNNLDTEFKYFFISILRSPLFEENDKEIFKYFKNNNYMDSDLYKKCIELNSYIDNTSIKDFIKLVIDKFNFYENIIKIGNINSNIIKLDYILNLTDNFSTLGYTIKDFVNYLDEIINKEYDIRFNENKEDNESVKIMTIHKSKGLEYNICYYSGLYSKFNISDLNDRFMFDNKYGIITPVFDEGIDTTIYKELLKNDYIKEEISEKIRLFYVALTRAKEKMIIVIDNDKETNYSKKQNGVINDYHRIKYRSFKDIVYSVRDLLDDDITNINLDDINITKDYNLIKNTNYIDFINKTNEKINIDEININNSKINEESFSKKENKLITQDIKNNMELGTNIHYILETLDFKNPNLDIEDKYIKDKIIKFLNVDLLKNINDSKIYKEYEFMYEEDNNLYHGIIDLMLVYNDHVDIIDYKLKNIDDENYINQLNGYKKYIENKLNKKTNIYLYSIFNEELLEI